MSLLPPPTGGPVYVAGSKPHGNLATADLDNLITNPLAFCTTGIFARVHQASVQTLTNAAYTVIQYDTIDEDNYAGWNAVNYSWAPPAGCSGWYHVRVGITLGTVPSGTGLRPCVAVNGNIAYSLQLAGSPGAPELSTGSAYVYLVGGNDYVQGQVNLGSTGNEPTNVTAGQNPLMEISFVSN